MTSEQQGVDRLRRLWDFTDLDTTERRLRSALREETTDSGRAEVLTQLARIEGLHSWFDHANRLLAEAEAVGGKRPRAHPGTRVHARLLLFGRFLPLGDFRARGFPAVPSLPASSLDGKEGVDGSRPSEGFAQWSQFRFVRPS